MKKAIRALTVTIGLLATSAGAYPSMRPYSSGSSLIIYMSNAEDRAYNCTINYAWAYDSFGDQKTGSESIQVSVPAKAPEFQAHRFAGSYVNLHFTDGPSMNCNPN